MRNIMIAAVSTAAIRSSITGGGARWQLVTIVEEA
jgi:hypothetical protein